jgi:hypothetical protein
MDNSVEIIPVKNSIELSTFDVYTTCYYLSLYYPYWEHKEAEK